ncbi:hypothetical protein [Nocardia sp. bgisy134]|uniref:hypothetical protein n=1 Tax=unclassified Nocardia TaxID=2637762 RepID=UPI003D72F6DC
MSEDAFSAVRRLPRPRPVLVDPKRIWLLPNKPGPQRPSLGVASNSLDPRFQEPWVQATQYGWVRLHLGHYVAWYAEVAVDYRTRNKLTETTLRHWVPWDAVRLPSAGKSS